MRNVVYHEVLAKDRIRNTENKVNPSDVIGRNFGDMDSNIPEDRLPYPEAKEKLTDKRLEEERFELRPETKADGNCFIHATMDQMR